MANYMGAVRKELGRDVFLLACWGVLPEAIGIVNGCRLGTDGFGPATLQQYNSWNGVVWRNDPDHCDILPGGRTRQRPPVPAASTFEESPAGYAPAAVPGVDGRGDAALERPPGRLRGRHQPGRRQA